MATRFEKTEAGHREIRDRAKGLARGPRTLLVLADGMRTGEELMSLVKGSTANDLAVLLDAGLIAATRGLEPSATVRAAPSTRPVPLQPESPVQAQAQNDAAPAHAEPAEAGIGYSELYDSLNALAKEQLGLFKGYRFSLEIEKASGLDELREVARRFVVEVRKVKGESAAQMVRRALGLKG
jgi:hypothetical protein